MISSKTVSMILILCLHSFGLQVVSQGTDPHPTGFESQSPGEFQTLETKVGRWIRVSGTPLVDDQHAKSGKQCLQLAGEDSTVVELELRPDVKTNGQLSFWAERWTKRAPFKFRIEKLSGNAWSEIYNGDTEVKVGREFLSNVVVPLNDANLKRLRFSVSSPPQTGILIDDLKFEAPKPQRITEIEVVDLAIPALAGAQASPILKLKIETEGTQDPILVQQVEMLLDARNQGDVESVQTYFTGSSDRFQVGETFGESLDPLNLTPSSALQEGTGDMVKPGKQVVSIRFRGEQALKEGTNYFWLTCTLKPDVDIDKTIGASVVPKHIVFSQKNDFKFDVDEEIKSIQQLGVAVRKRGDEGIHTFRIPGLATTNQGTLIGVYDVRHDKGGDLPGNIDVGLSRSTDGGRNWQPMEIIMDMGDDPNWNFDGIGDPSILVDQTTGTIWVSATWSHGNRSWNGSGPGINPEETGQWMIVKSDDDGMNWSDPINITAQVKRPEWAFLLQGPGKGITMSDGTIVFPAQYQDPPNPNDKVAHRLPHSTIVFSRDQGKTWECGTGAYDDTTESQVVELAPGELMLNCRYNRESKRVVMTTTDMGKTWKPHPTNVKALIEPRSCMASLINVGRELVQKPEAAPVNDANLDPEVNAAIASNQLLLFSNPNSLSGRNHITIKASLDGGKTWPRKHQLLLDEETGAGYSCMSMIDAETVGILYEGSQAQMTFQRVKLKNIINPPSDQKTSNPRLSLLPLEKIKLNRNKRGQFSVARVFQDNMVLQANQPIRVWGTAAPDSKLEILFASKITDTTSDSQGHWLAELPPEPYDAVGQSLVVQSSGDLLSLENILIGEVWFCAGQSNMEWPLDQTKHGNETIRGASDPQLRLMNFVGAARGGGGLYEMDQLNRLRTEVFSTGDWKVSDPESASKVSAVGFYFAENLREELKCPVGLINVSIGGTPIESWVSRDALQSNSKLSEMVSGNWLDNPSLDDWCKRRGKENLKFGLAGMLEMPVDEFGPNHSFKPGFMYDSAVKPFAPMSIRGVLWYQGESNADNLRRIEQYNAAFPVLVSSWRTAFMNSDMPVCFVQLPGMSRPNWPIFREFQRRSLNQLTNVGMAITMDVGHPTDVHPREKKQVGERMAAWALGEVYGQPVITSGPLFVESSLQVESNKLTFEFEHIGDGLRTNDNKLPRHFEIAGNDRVYHSAQATIESKHQIELTCSHVSEPKYARYAWIPFPDPSVNLINSNGFPASPFTTESLSQFIETRN